MARTILANCRALLGIDAKLSEGPVDIVIDGRRIVEVRPAQPSGGDEEVVDASGRLVTAGLINGHTHSHENFHKGRFDNLPIEMLMNFLRPPDPLRLTPRQAYLRTLIGAIEALRTGTTTLVDDLNVSPVFDAEVVEAVLQAYEDIGIRALVGLSLFDLPYYRAVPFVNEEFPPDLLAALDAKPKAQTNEALAYARHLAATRHPKSSRTAFIVAPSAPQRCSAAFLRELRELADEYDLPTIIHVQETRMQVVTGQKLFGATFVEHLAQVGFLKPKTTLIHGVWLNPREIDLLAQSGATIQHNPVSNLNLASGLAPIRALLDAGVNVSLGTDGCACTDTLDMLRVVDTMALTGKLRGDVPESWLGAPEAWKAGTMGGATALGLEDDLGAVEAGRIADLAVWRLDRIPFVPLNNPLQQLVYAERGASLDMLFVDGDCVMRDGELTRIKEDEILEEIAEAHKSLLPAIEESQREVEPLKEAYRRIYERCLREPIAQDTFPARFTS